MQTRCPKCTTIVKSVDGISWTIVNPGCQELAGSNLKGHPEFCPTLCVVAQPDVTLPGLKSSGSHKMRSASSEAILETAKPEV